MKRLAAIAVLFAALQGGFVACPIDDLSSIWTGQVKYDSGHTFHQYKCLRGHLFWIRVS